jgi:hypothetical protein
MPACERRCKCGGPMSGCIEQKFIIRGKLTPFSSERLHWLLLNTAMVVLCLVLSLFFSLKSRYAAGCAGEGQAGLDCGASRGIDPLKCCEGLECQDGKCVFNRGGSTGCPTALVDCVSWSVSCGKCQALHWIARVINEAGDPVNEAVVRQKTTTQNGSVVGPSTKTTSPGLFSS